MRVDVCLHGGLSLFMLRRRGAVRLAVTRLAIPAIAIPAAAFTAFTQAFAVLAGLSGFAVWGHIG